jgi:plasmid maintenance system antidote protein VapI
MEAKDLKNLTADCQRLIKEYLKREQISVHALGKLAKVHPTQLHLFIKGERGLNLTTMQRVANVICNEKS